ncbi:MAG: V-type ATP synthase subunit I [Candidatus Njordarchaeales archaeon]
MPIVPVKKMTIITLQEFEDLILTELGRRSVIELKALSEEEFGGFRKVTVKEIRDIENLLTQLMELYKKLGIARVPSKMISQITARDLLQAREKLAKYSIEIDKVLKEITRINEELRHYELLSVLVACLRKEKIPLTSLREKKKKVLIGVVSNKTIPYIKKTFGYFSRIRYKFFRLNEKASILFLEIQSTLEDYVMTIEDYLKLMNFKPLSIPRDIPLDFSQAQQFLQEKIKSLKTTQSNLAKKLENIKTEFLNEAPILDSLIRSAYAIATAKLNMLRSRMMTVIQGWVPEDQLEEVQSIVNRLKSETKNRLLVFFEDPLPGEEIPTVLRSPTVFKPYESLIRQYGVPDPHETDPTIISGILWTIMFGFMFPDFGQGLVILILGVLFAYFLKRKDVMGLPIKKVGKLMIGAGFSAAFFGLLVGDFFLTEHIIHPLWPGLTPGWVEKPSNVIWLLKIAIYFGIIQITIALLISIYNSIKEGHYIEALLGEKGLAGLIVFWSFILIAFTFLGITVIPEIPVPWGGKIPRIAFPELRLEVFNILSPQLFIYKIPVILFVTGILLMFIKPIIEKEGAAIAFGGVFETIIAFMSNTLSYTRLAGFNIAHVALAIVIARLLEANPILGIGIGLIFLNVFALTLEFLVVMIQALRLVFYEFMTKFYRGTGRSFRPFRIL